VAQALPTHQEEAHPPDHTQESGSKSYAADPDQFLALGEDKPERIMVRINNIGPSGGGFGYHIDTAPLYSAGGEIDVLDPAGYGTVTITKAISIVNAGVGAPTIGTSLGDGVTINAGAGDSVHLRGLTVEGLGSGKAGITFITGGPRHITDSYFVATGWMAGRRPGHHPMSPSSIARFPTTSPSASRRARRPATRPPPSRCAISFFSNNGAAGLDAQPNAIFRVANSVFTGSAVATTAAQYSATATATSTETRTKTRAL
jgi:hypothetical protein